MGVNGVNCLHINFISQQQELYPFTPSNMARFSCRAVASQLYMCPAKQDNNIDQCAKIGYFLLFSAILSWRATASQYYILMSGFAGHMYSWLAIARQEKIATLLGVNGYNSCC